MKKTEEKGKSQKVSESILSKVDKLIPGFHGFFKRMEGSKTFGPKITEICKEIEHRFGGTKK